MTAKAAYQFLKPSLEGLSQKEREELCRLISGKPKIRKEAKEDEKAKRIAEMKKRLLKTGLFKN